MNTTINISGYAVTLDREAAYDLALLLSNLHGRYCSDIEKCGDMDVASDLAQHLLVINPVHTAITEVCNMFDGKSDA